MHPIPYASPDLGKPPNKFIVLPVGWPLAIFAVVLAGFSLYAASGPAAYILSSLAAALGWAIAMLWWGIKALLSLRPALRADPQVPKFWWKFLAAPFLLAITLCLIVADLPARAAFVIARPAMERIARAQLTTPDGTTLSADVNVYGSCTFSHIGNTVTVEVRDAGFIDSHGYAYCPAGLPSAEGRTTPLEAPWFKWFHKF